MKTSTFTALHTYANTDPNFPAAIRDEINAEWNHKEEKRQSNKSTYDAAHDVFINALTDTPQTSKEIFEGNEWPADFTQGKLNYAIRALWSEEVKKIDNGKNPFTYTKK